jgi:probable rRNA maturation factor
VTRPPKPDWRLLDPREAGIKVGFVNETGRPCPAGTLREVAKAVFSAHDRKQGTLSFLVAEGQRLRELNFRFRGTDETTDVLSFPPPQAMARHLGDIAVNREMAALAGQRPGWSEEAELAHLAAHGCLHLLGYQDDDEAGLLQMVRTANHVLGRLGLPTDAHWRSLDH